MIDYQTMIKNVEGYSPQRISTKKKFQRRMEDCPIQQYEIYFIDKRLRYDENINRKFYNHLRWQGKDGTTNQTVHRRYNANVYTYVKKSKGIFECRISYGTLRSTYYVDLTRTSISLSFNGTYFNLDDKSERFAASLDYDFDYDQLLIIQSKLKKKPSGTYYIYTDQL